MHQGTVPVAIDICFEALVWTVPSNLANIAAATWPVGETFKVILDTHCNFMRHQIQKCIAQANFCLEIGRHVQEVILSGEALIIQYL